MIKRLIRAASRGRLSVFLFHKVPLRKPPILPDDIDLAEFNHILDLVGSQFTVIPLDEAVRRLESSLPLPPTAACITFDDGYPDWTSGAIPELTRRGLHATFFITTGQINGHPMWHERIANAVQQFPKDSLVLNDSGLPVLDVASLDARHIAVKRIEAHLKYQAVSYRDEILTNLESVAGVSSSELPTMTPGELRSIHSKGFAIGAHTMTHPILRLCDPATAKDEIGGAREELESIVRDRVTLFAYPNGHPVADFAELHVKLVRQAGYLGAVTTQPGAAGFGSPIFQIPRFTPWGPDRLRMELQIIRNVLSTPTYLSA